MSEPAEDMFDFGYAVARIQALEKTWNQEIQRTEERRQVRYFKKSNKQMRKEGLIPSNGVFIVRRIAHTNIKRMQAPIVAYYTQSKDTAKFRALDNLPLPPEPLNAEFTRFAQHKDYNQPFFETWDGACTHGWDSLETVLDEDAPGHFLNKHIGHEFLWFAWDATDIQNCPLVVVVEPITIVQLAELAPSFDEDAMKQVEEKLASIQDKDAVRVRLMKFFFKVDGVVQMGYYCEWADRFLLAPKPFELGQGTKQGPEFESDYPIEILRFSISEDMVITSSLGQVFEDEPDQEGCSQLATSFVNRAIRSQLLMFSPTGTDDDAAERQSKVEIEDGMIMKRPVKEFHLEAADIQLLNGMGIISGQNANEQGQVNFAVQNRKDSRKTATEIGVASQEGAKLSGVQVVMLSAFTKNVATRNWAIVKSRVLNGKLTSSIINWPAYYNRQYTLLPAGDVDVIKRQETLMAMKQDWPVIQTTGARQVFLEDMIRLSPYAENADKYIRAMEAENWKDNLIKGMGNALTQITVDPKTGQLNAVGAPFAKQLSEIHQEYLQVMTPPGQKPEAQPQEQPQQQDEPPAR